MSVCRAPQGRSARRRTAWPLAGAAVAVLAVAACGSGGTSSGSADVGFVPGTGGIDTVKKAARKPAPRLSGESVDGERIDLADYRGKIVVMNVWGSWCAPCRAEMPHLVRVAKATKDDGVAFVGINTRDPNRVPAARFEKEFEVPYPSLYDPEGRLMLRFPQGSLNPKAIPSTVVIDRKGGIAARALKALSADELRRTLEPLIAEK